MIGQLFNQRVIDRLRLINQDIGIFYNKSIREHIEKSLKLEGLLKSQISNLDLHFKLLEKTLDIDSANFIHRYYKGYYSEPIDTVQGKDEQQSKERDFCYITPELLSTYSLHMSYSDLLRLKQIPLAVELYYTYNPVTTGYSYETDYPYNNRIDVYDINRILNSLAQKSEPHLSNAVDLCELINKTQRIRRILYCYDLVYGNNKPSLSQSFYELVQYSLRVPDKEYSEFDELKFELHRSGTVDNLCTEVIDNVPLTLLSIRYSYMYKLKPVDNIYMFLNNRFIRFYLAVPLNYMLNSSPCFRRQLSCVPLLLDFGISNVSTIKKHLRSNLIHDAFLIELKNGTIIDLGSGDYYGDLYNMMLYAIRESFSHADFVEIYRQNQTPNKRLIVLDARIYYTYYNKILHIRLSLYKRAESLVTLPCSTRIPTYPKFLMPMLIGKDLMGVSILGVLDIISVDKGDIK